jgi:hypothetical protein
MISVGCPSCGNPVAFATATTGYAVCDACQSMLVRSDMDVTKIGQSAGLIEDGSPLQIGASGRWKNVSFDLVGRIQVAYPFGFWNEWYAAFGNGSEGWIGEAQGNYFVNFAVDTPPALPPFDQLRRGMHLTIGGQAFAVTQVQRALVIGCQGSLPFLQNSGWQAPVADLRSATATGATLDYSDDPPLAFVGEYVDFAQLHFSNLREIEGWS